LPTAGSNPTDEPTSDNSSCWGSGWSWNPISWVYVPIKCALQWAFVPSAGTWTDAMAQPLADWKATGPGQWLGGLGDMFTAGIPGLGAGDCLGPLLDFTGPMGVHVHVYPFAACSGITATLAVIVRVGATVAVWIGVALTGMRMLGASMGMNLNGVGRSSP
jgi:hypothetical protein